MGSRENCFIIHTDFPNQSFSRLTIFCGIFIHYRKLFVFIIDCIPIAILRIEYHFFSSMDLSFWAKHPNNNMSSTETTYQTLCHLCPRNNVTESGSTFENYMYFYLTSTIVKYLAFNFNDSEDT